MILVIDNFDSFTYNIVEYYSENGHNVKVFRNNEVTLSEIEALAPKLILLSPGPKDPSSAGICMEVIKHFAGKVPLFGVCLGCQAIAQVYGAKIIRAEKMYHGKTSLMTHIGQGVLDGMPSPMTQMRYHSLIIDETTLDNNFVITARSTGGEIMAIKHMHLAIEGVQFHPESIASLNGHIILENTLSMQHNDKLLHNIYTSTIPHEEDQIQKFLSIISNKLLDKKNLNRREASVLMSLFTEGVVAPEAIAMILTALRIKGERAEEIAGIVEIAREKAVSFPLVDIIPHLVDVVGTGGDNKHTFNISTAAAIVAAGAGAKVAKHGNRAVTSKSGSAEVLEALGIDIMKSPKEMVEMLTSTGMCYMFAPLYHPSMKHVAPVRKAMKIRTLFNILGPLVNPAKVPSIVLGVYSKDLMPLMADVLLAINIKHGLVIHSESGTDEITIDSVTHCLDIKDNKFHELIIDPHEYTMHPIKLNNTVIEAMHGGTKEQNAKLIEDMLTQSLDKEIQYAVENVVSLNAGAVLYVAGVVTSFKDGVDRAYSSIHSGAALKVLKGMRNI